MLSPYKKESDVQYWLPRVYQNDDWFTVQTVYLGYVCAQGDLAKIKRVLQDPLAKVMMNSKQAIFNGGTVLHMALFWNTGDTAVELYKLLTTCGAKPGMNDDEELPWEQTGFIWVNYLNPYNLGTRNEREYNEFAGAYKQIQELAQPKP